MKFFTPGPTALLPSIRGYINEAIDNDLFSISHRSQEFKDIYKNAVIKLKQLMGIPDDYHVFFLGSSTECMERIISNLVIENSFHFVNGAFSKKFYEFSKELNKNSNTMAVEEGKAFENIIIPESELICFTHSETSTGVITNMDYIYNAKKNNPNALVVVDITSSAPYVEIDYNKIDAAFFSVQKGFGMPAGLGIMVCNDKCIAKSKEVGINTFHSIPSLLKKGIEYQTNETPNMLGIYLLGKVCDEMINFGIENIRRDIETKYNIIKGFVDKSKFEFFVDEDIRSKGIIILKTDMPKQVINKMKERGFVIGSGYGDLKESQIRIANFHSQSVEDTKDLVSELSNIFN